jgi:hypothetical protein
MPGGWEDQFEKLLYSSPRDERMEECKDDSVCPLGLMWN